MHEPFIAAVPAMPSVPFRRVRAASSRVAAWMGPMYPDSPRIDLSEGEKRDLRFFSGVLTGLPISLLLWVGLYHLMMAVL